jgi:hypothetical protein
MFLPLTGKHGNARTADTDEDVKGVQNMIKLLAIYGAKKTGKTTFAMSCPTPSVLFDFELGSDRVKPEFIPDDMEIIKVYEPRIGRTIEDNDILAEKYWSNFEDKYYEALENPAVNSIIFDTSTKLWAAKRHVGLAEIRKEYPTRKALNKFEYGPLNADMEQLVMDAKVAEKLLVLTHHTKDVYIGENPTGEVTWDGFSHTGDMVDVILYFRKLNNKPYVTIEDCGLAMEADGMEFEAPTYQEIYDYIATQR